jgi:uracil-DNA glycosylase
MSLSSPVPGSAAWSELASTVIACRLCPRLVAWREEVAQTKRRAYRLEEYWGRPVPGFGDQNARVLIVGLAPAAHGANRTGRMFTGDSSGDFLYSALYRAGFASQPVSRQRGDGLVLHDAFISAVCRCAPPDNKPAPGEIDNCLPYLSREIALLERCQVIVALGKIGFDGALRALRALQPVQKTGSAVSALIAGTEKPAFAHAAVHEFALAPLPGVAARPRWLVSSYHPSRQNTQTGRLTPAMFDVVWNKVRELLAPA